MFLDFTTFFTLWIIVLLLVSTTGFILFSELVAYESLWKVFVIHFESALGNWLNTIYDDLSLGSTFGQAFHLLSVVLNLILMLNMVIAILMETFARMATQKRGLYYDTLISQLPAYEYDSRWGVLILAPPPLNLLILPLVLLFWCLESSSERLLKINEIFVKILYFPMAIIFTIVFVLGNFFLTPVSFFKLLVYKIWHVCCCCYHQKNLRGRYSKQLHTSTSACDLTLFAVLGMPMLMIS